MNGPAPILAAALALASIASLANAAPQVAPGKSTDPRMKAVVDDLVSANRILAAKGILPGYGHVSARSPLDPTHVLISRSLAPGQVTAADIVELDLDCKPIVPNGPLLYQERFIHCAIYKARPDVGGVVHSHTPAVIAFSISDVPLKPVENSGRLLGFNGPPVHDVSNVKGPLTNNLIASQESGASLAETLGKGSVVLMRGHGSTVVAPSVRAVVTAVMAVETNAQISIQAHILGASPKTLNPKDYGNERLQNEIGAEARGWNALKAEALAK